MLREFTGTGIDDTAALMALVASATPQDEIRLYGKCVTSQRFSPPCSWGGVSPFESQLIALSGSGISLASISDRSGISVTKIELTGEGVPNGAFGLAVGSPTTAAEDQLVEGCTFSKFSNGQWIDGGAAAGCNGLRIRKSHFASTAADYPGTGGGGTFIYLQNSTGFFTNTEIADNIMEGQGVAFGAALFGAHLGFEISGNQVSNLGQSVTPGPTSGRYAFTIYGTADGQPSNGITRGNAITNPAEAGVYIANAASQTVTGNQISGQYGTANSGSLPRGAIVANGLNGGLIGGNDLEDNLWGISYAGGDGTPGCYNISSIGNRIKNARDSNANAFFMDGVTLVANARLLFLSNDIYLFGGGATAFGGTISGTGNVVAAYNTVRAANLGFVGWTGASVITSPNILG